MKTNKLFAFVLAAAALALASLTTSAQVPTYIYGSVNAPIINTAAFVTTTNSTSTNYSGSYGVARFPWTNSITGDYTNLTLLTQPGTKDLALEFSGQEVTPGTGTAPATNVLIRLAYNVRGSGTVNTTNAVTGPQGIQNSGLPLPYVVFAQITNSISTNGFGDTVVGFTTQVPAVALPNVLQLNQLSDGAIPYIYVLDVTTPTGVVLTNFSVYVNAQ